MANNSSTATPTTDPTELNDPPAPIRVYQPPQKVSPGPDMLTPSETPSDTPAGTQLLNPSSQLISNVQTADAATGTPDPSASALLNSVGNGISSAWGSLFGKIAIIGGLAALATLLVLHFTSSSKNTVTVKPTMTAAASEQAITSIDTNLSKTADGLIKAGYNKDVVQTQEAAIAIEDGTAIQLATPRVTTEADRRRTVVVTGTTNPSTYVPLLALNSKKYVRTISQSPTQADITENSAVVHGLDTAPQ